MNRRRKAMAAAWVITFTGTILGCAAWAYQPEIKQPCFTPAERFCCLVTENRPGYYQTVTLKKKIALTPAASEWFDHYRRITFAMKNSDQTRVTSNRLDVWDDWVNEKVTFDWNAAASQMEGQEDKDATPANQIPPIPPDLAARVGIPPAFAEPVTPVQYKTCFFGPNLQPSDACVVLKDHPSLGKTFRYYRFSKGVMERGHALRHWSTELLNALFTESGLSSSEARIFLAVSQLEGGFDSVNTYDSGYVSIGFLQFSAGPAGDGSLLKVLNEEHRFSPEAYKSDFTSLGIDVDKQGILHVVDPAQGRERQGAAAVRCMIREPRLSAIFARAGRQSRSFQEAQLRVAKQLFLPDDDPVSIRLADGTLLTGCVRDAIKSEAGLATLMDTKINTGKLSPVFQQALQDTVLKRRLHNWHEIAEWEREIISNSVGRGTFLNRSDLSQPPPLPHSGVQMR